MTALRPEQHCDPRPVGTAAACPQGPRPAKTCFKCRQCKPIDSFYRHPRMADGHLNKCKSCARMDEFLHRAANPERVAESERKRNAKPARRIKGVAVAKRWRERHPERVRAHAAVRRAVRSGKLTRPTHCQSCGKPSTIHAHHNDYRKPLDVMWLCVRCHAEHHHARDILSGAWR